MALTGREKATILLSVLGTETSAKILRHLPEELADLIAAGVNKLPTPSKEALSTVLSEFGEFMALPSPPKGPAAIEARKLERPRAEAKTSMDIILSTSSRVLSTLLFKERPQTIAFLLSNLPQTQAAEVLAVLPEQRREIEVLLRDIRKNPLSEKLRDRIFESLAKKVSGA